MSSPNPKDVMLSLLEADPGIPVPNPTTPFWQIPPHPLADVASVEFPTATDVIIIGSGITGCSVAKGLLEGHPSLKVTVLEARGLASGASSRNGGHIVSPSFQDFPSLVKVWGAKTAAEIAEFTLTNCERTFEAVEQFSGFGLEEFSEIRRTEKILGFRDQESVEKFQEILAVWNKEMPAHRKDLFKLINGEEAKEKYGIRNLQGAAVGTAAAVWPYRLWAGMWALLYEKYQERLSIETFTPALSIKKISTSTEESSYVVTTPKGEIRASRIVYCTNGFTSHLLPNLRGKIFPFRGTMSTQNLGSDFPNHGANRSWSFLRSPRFDPQSGINDAGLYYLTQNPKSGYMFLGGEQEKLENIICSDDSKINHNSAEKVVEQLSELFEGAVSSPDVKSIWSGIMGFTNDGIPIIGRLPEQITNRPEGGEWIAAGFNGYGTGYCYCCGQAVAEMMLGKDVSKWVPSAFLMTKERFQTSLTTAPFWEGLLPV